MYIFPDVSSVGTGGTAPVTAAPSSTVDEKQEKDKQNINTEKTVTVFSNYDGNSDKKVSYSEANANSLFTQADLSNNAAAHLNSDVSAEVKASLQKMALAKYNPTNAFKNLLSNFSSKTGSEKIKFAHGTVDQSQVNAKAAELDKIAQKDAQTASVKANNEIMQKYNEALDAALNQYNATNGETGDISNINADDAKGSKASPKEFTEAQNTKQKTEVEAFSTYDNNKDKHVKYNEAQGKFKQTDLSTLKPAYMADTSALNTVKGMVGYDAVTMFQKELASFDVKTGKETLKFDGEADESKVKAKIAEMDAKADEAITKANTKANEKVNKDYTKALDKAYAQFLANGGTIQEEAAKPDVPDNSTPEAPEVPDPQQPVDDKPVVEEPPVQEHPVDNQPITYKINKGDTLTKIAKQHNVSIKDIMEANETGKGKAIVNQNLIIAGREIKIPKKEEV